MKTLLLWRKNESFWEGGREGGRGGEEVSETRSLAFESWASARIRPGCSGSPSCWTGRKCRSRSWTGTATPDWPATAAPAATPPATLLSWWATRTWLRRRPPRCSGSSGSCRCSPAGRDRSACGCTRGRPSGRRRWRTTPARWPPSLRWTRPAWSPEGRPWRPILRRPAMTPMWFLRDPSSLHQQPHTVSLVKRNRDGSNKEKGNWLEWDDGENLYTMERGPRTRICCAVETDSSRNGFNTWRPVQYWVGSTHCRNRINSMLPSSFHHHFIIIIVGKWISYQFEIALGFGRIAGAQSQLAVDVELAQIRVILAHLHFNTINGWDLKDFEGFWRILKDFEGFWRILKGGGGKKKEKRAS